MAHFRKDCITFFMTTKCNLACSYCYLQHSNLEPQSINLDFAKQGIIDYFSQSQSRHIRFFGAGEPTLEFEKIVEISTYAEKLAGHSLIVEVQTNGVFSPKIANWLSRNAHIVWISCDGTPDIQDQQRPTKKGGKTSPVVERNIRSLVEDNNVAVGVRSTITPLNLYRQQEMLLYFASLGIKAIYSDPVFPPVEENTNKIQKNPFGNEFNLEYAKEFLKAQEVAERLSIFYGSIFTINFDERSELFCRSCIPSPHLTTDDYVSCCDMAYLGEILPNLIYGKYNKDTGLIQYDQRKIQAIRLRRVSNLQECKGCEVLYNCAGSCFGEGVNETGELLGVKKDYCEAIRYLAQNMPRNQGLYPYLHP